MPRILSSAYARGSAARVCRAGRTGVRFLRNGGAVRFRRGRAPAAWAALGRTAPRRLAEPFHAVACPVRQLGQEVGGDPGVPGPLRCGYGCFHRSDNAPTRAKLPLPGRSRRDRRSPPGAPAGKVQTPGPMNRPGRPLPGLRQRPRIGLGNGGRAGGAAGGDVLEPVRNAADRNAGSRAFTDTPVDTASLPEARCAPPSFPLS